MQVTAAMVKEVRERSGAAMMECKKALVETAGDVEAALDHLRKSGAAKAAKKAGRIAAEGAIIALVKGDKGVIVEVNSETDFAANDDNFRAFANAVAETILAERPDDVDALGSKKLAGTSDTVEESRTQLVAKIGENISVRRFAVIEASGGALAAYLHGNRIGVLAEVAGGDDALSKDIAMHIAASNPLCVADTDVPEELVAKEKEIQVAQAEQSGKPADIIEKMVSGRIRKFIAEISLTGQPFVKDPDTTVGKLLKERDAKVLGFTRYEVGAGIEKKEDNFAEEVMAQARAASRDGSGDS
ncbi:MAG: translation elongation factor Ts [Gammaproteobacteria bacterium]|jgi:elongation factor Ts